MRFYDLHLRDLISSFTVLGLDFFVSIICKLVLYENFYMPDWRMSLKFCASPLHPSTEVDLSHPRRPAYNIKVFFAGV